LIKVSISDSGTGSTPIVCGKADFSKQEIIMLHEFPQSGSPEPKGFGRRFAFFAAVGKEGRAGVRSSPPPLAALRWCFPWQQKNSRSFDLLFFVCCFASTN